VNEMDDAFKGCLEEGRLAKIPVQQDLIQKEMNAARSDLKTAQESAAEGKHKWATVQAYYSMFHAAKALVLSKGYREKSHACLVIALRNLFIETGLLETKHYNHFRDCMHLRQDADYGLTYSPTSAQQTLDWAKQFIDETDKQLKTV